MPRISRAQLRKAIATVDYPMDKDDLVRHAKQANAAEECRRRCAACRRSTIATSTRCCARSRPTSVPARPRPSTPIRGGVLLNRASPRICGRRMAGSRAGTGTRRGTRTQQEARADAPLLLGFPLEVTLRLQGRVNSGRPAAPTTSPGQSSSRSLPAGEPASRGS